MHAGDGLRDDYLLVGQRRRVPLRERHRVSDGLRRGNRGGPRVRGLHRRVLLRMHDRRRVGRGRELHHLR